MQQYLPGQPARHTHTHTPPSSLRTLASPLLVLTLQKSPGTAHWHVQSLQQPKPYQMPVATTSTARLLPSYMSTFHWSNYKAASLCNKQTRQPSKHAPPSRTLASPLLLLTLRGSLLSPGTATAGAASRKLGQRVKPQEMRSDSTTDSTKLMASALLTATCRRCSDQAQQKGGVHAARFHVQHVLYAGRALEARDISGGDVQAERGMTSCKNPVKATGNVFKPHHARGMVGSLHPKPPPYHLLTLLPAGPAPQAAEQLHEAQQVKWIH